MKAAAVPLDLAFVLHRLWMPLGSRTATANEIRAFAERCIRTAEEELFRIYCYHCRPYGETETHPLTRTPIYFSSTDTFVNMTALIRERRGHEDRAGCGVVIQQVDRRPDRARHR